MALSNSFLVKLYYRGSLVDFTSRCLEFSTSVSAPVGVFGAAELSIRFLNNDGALTPNGGGTYQNTDWFNWGIYIENEVYDTALEGYFMNEQIFSGVISKFNLYDDGRESYVEITAVDAYGKLSQTGELEFPPFAGEGKDLLSQLLSDPWSQTTGLPGTNVFPTSGFTSSYGTNDWQDGILDFGMEHAVSRTHPSLLSLFSDGIANTGNAPFWPTYVLINEASDYIEYHCATVGQTKTRELDYQVDQYFTQSSTLTYGQLPFKDLEQEFENETLANRVSATGLFTGASQEQSDSTNSQEKYGIRALNKGNIYAYKKNSTMSNTASASITAQGELTDVKSRCNELVQRYFLSSFAPRTLSLSWGQVKSKGIESRINLVKNPSFYTDTSYWNSAQTLTRDTGLGYDGSTSGRILWTNAIGDLADTTVTITSTGRYVFSMYFYVAPASPLIGRTVTFSRTSGTATSTAVSSSSGVLVSGTWVRATSTADFTTTGTVTLTATISGAHSVGAQINIDAALAEKGSTVGTYWTPVADEYEPKLLGGAYYWGKLLSAQYALWQKATILWTGKGASSQSQDLMILKRTINANPTDVQVTLELQPYYDNHSFQLGVDKLSQGKVA